MQFNYFCGLHSVVSFLGNTVIDNIIMESSSKRLLAMEGIVLFSAVQMVIMVLKSGLDCCVHYIIVFMRVTSVIVAHPMNCTTSQQN